MNKTSKLFIALAASSMMFSSCSSDEPAVTPVTPSEGGVYATLTLSLPQGRSETVTPDDNTNSDAGYENGQDSENNVGSVLVIIAKKAADGSYTYVTSNLADAQTATGNNARPTYNIQFETRELVKEAGEDVYVFAMCNPTTALIEAADKKFPEGFENAMGSASENIWTKNGFFMSNALISDVKTLPSETQMNELYNTPANPFFLGTVKVERAAARFDFEQTQVENYEMNRYPIYNHQNSDFDEEGNPVVDEKHLMGYVQLDGMALINQANNFYYLPRVSADGMATNVTLCGQETPTNYVVSPFATDKAADELSLDFITKNYSYTAGVSAAGYDFTTLNYDAFSSLTQDDNDANWKPGQGTNYKIWRYTTENTIPGVSTQRKGITTGIVFKGHLVAADNTSDLGKVINAGTQVIYAYNGVLYGNLEMLKAAVVANPVSTLAEAFKVAFGVNDLEAETMDAVTTDLTDSKGKFTLYRPVAGQYDMYYLYLNRHNDNGNNTVMHTMEFATVRNNVYKIKVNNVLEFGHPGKPGDDPDPETPGDPDETPKTYFRVQVQVLPWVVRVNNIIL